MKQASILVTFILLLGLPSNTGRACGRPPLPPDIPCVGFGGSSIVLQLGTVFQTNTPHSCAASIGLLGSPADLNFTVADVGVVNTLTNTFSPSFALNRFSGSDNAWAMGMGMGMDINGTQALPGATWFGFSNLVVPPVFPPTLGANDIFAIRFNIDSPFNPTAIQGLQVQYGAGLGTSTGLPDFITPDPTHAAQYSQVTRVPAFGTTDWRTVPEPASAITWLLLGSTLFAGRIIRRRRVGLEY